MIRRIFLTLIFSLAATAQGNSTILEVTGYDVERQRAAIQLSSDMVVPLGTQMRVNARNGESCIIEIIERVNTQLVAATPECSPSNLREGLKLTYSDGIETDIMPQTFTSPRSVASEPIQGFDNPVEEVSVEHPTMIDDGDWPAEGRFSSPVTTVSSSPSQLPESLAMLRDRVSVYIGHNFSSNLEGKVYADGSYKNLDGDSAFSLGVQGRVYDINPRLSVVAGLGYEFARNFDEATFTNASGGTFTGRPPTGNPRLSLWSLFAQVEGQLLDKLSAFGGVNLSIPFLSQVTWDARTDIGFQAGVNYQVYDRILLEGLIKISNINLQNQLGETTDVSLAGLEIRGRYTF